MGLFLILSFALRSISTAGKYGLIPAEIPLLAVPIKDPTLSNYEAETSGELVGTTPMVVLTEKAFIFGDVTSFSSNVTDIRNKFFVRHVKGSPDINTLVKDMEKWIYARSSKHKIVNQGIVVFLPSDNIPTPLVILSVDGLQKTNLFNRVVLSGGLK